MSLEGRYAAWEHIAQEVEVCQACVRGRQRRQALAGEGPLSAQVMFVAEAPRTEEDRNAEPMCAEPGWVFEEYLGVAGLTRREVFITYLTKCYAINDFPEPEEAMACSPFLERQIALVDPIVIATFGKMSMRYFLPNAALNQIHGLPHEVNGRIIFPLLAPFTLISNEFLRPVFDEDYRNLRDLLRKLRDGGDSPNPNQQMSLF